MIGKNALYTGAIIPFLGGIAALSGCSGDAQADASEAIASNPDNQEAAQMNEAVTVKSIEAEISDTIAKGSSVAEVEDFLSAKGYEHSELIDNAKLAHMGFDPDTYEMKAMIRDVRSTGMVSTGISMTFVFDREKLLIDQRVEEVNTGP